MNLYLARAALLRHKGLLLASLVIGVVLALLTLVTVVSVPSSAGPAGRLRLERRSLSTYTQTVAVLIDTPGFGLGRADVSMAKPTQMAPTFAYLAGSQEVVRRVEKTTGSLKDKVTITAIPVQDSPLVQIVVEGKDQDLVAKTATALGAAVSDYVREQQAANDVASTDRLVLQPLGSPSPPVEVQSRALETAAILFLLPLLASVSLALILDNFQRSAVAAEAVPVQDAS